MQTMDISLSNMFSHSLIFDQKTKNYTKACKDEIFTTITLIIQLCFSEYTHAQNTYNSELFF